MQMRLASLCALLAGADAYVLAPARPTASCRRSTDSEMILSYKVAGMVGTAAVVGGVTLTRKLLPKKEDPSVAAFRSSLSGMESLSELSELKLEQDGREGRVIGVWKEYIKSDGKKWYFNTETKTQTWMMPEEFKKLEEVSAAAAAANQARGTSLG